MNPGIASLIREDEVRLIPQVIADGAEEGMQTFNMSLVGLVKDKLITEEDARLSSDNPDELDMNIKGIYLSTSKGGILKK